MRRRILTAREQVEMLGPWRKGVEVEALLRGDPIHVYHEGPNPKERPSWLEVNPVWDQRASDAYKDYLMGEGKRPFYEIDPQTMKRIGDEPNYFGGPGTRHREGI